MDALAGLDPQYHETLHCLSDMAAGLAHEMNQPLNNLTVILHTLQRSLKKKHQLSDPQLDDDIAQVLAQAKRMHAIIEHLRQFAAQKIGDPAQPVLPSAIVSGALEFMRARIEQANIALSCNLAEGLPQVCVNQALLEQVLYHLLQNAFDAILKFGPLEPWIKLSVSVDDGTVNFEVADNGVGLSDVVQQRIFQPFFTTKEVGQGMGLGLAASWGIVQAFGGHIHCSSDTEHGTRFTVALPVFAAPLP